VTSEGQTLKEEVDALDWYHTIDLGNGIVTPGKSLSPVLKPPMLPEFAGKTVLDIGAWDGLYSFKAEQSGARRVVALDHYVWGVEFGRRNRYWDECAARGEIPDPDRDMEFWNPELPRKRPFDLARQALGSNVEAVVGDFMTMDMAALGTFDVVLFLGVLYHMPDPYGALRRLRKLTSGVAVIETEAIEVAGHLRDALLQFTPGDEMSTGDYGNWFAVTDDALHAMCRAAGFSSVRTIGERPSPKPSGLRSLSRALQSRRSVRRYRIVVHAYAGESR
jgi:tRNA (mo5U34)-methyltransferase